MSSPCEPRTRVEEWLDALLNDTEGPCEPRTRVELWLQALLEKSGNNVHYIADTGKTTEQKQQARTNIGAQATLVFDPTPTEGSSNSVTSGAVYAAIAASCNIPANIATAAEMDAVLVSANVGKAYKYIGATTSTYTHGDIYVVEESE